MPLGHHGQLLGQARQLLILDPRRPRQANLKRALSTAYYALFHLLIHDAVGFLVGQKAPYRSFLTRAFSHTNMLSAAKEFHLSHVEATSGRAVQSGRRSSVTPSSAPSTALAIPPDLNAVADTFVLLQETRHQADYDVSRRFTRKEAEALVGQAEAAFVSWKAVRKSPSARFFLLAMLVGGRSRGR
jgi:hypothetical protein